LEISEHSENPVSKISELFLNFFWTFPNFFQTFWPKNRVFWLKNSNFTYFFQNLRTISNNFRTFSELKFPNFFPNFFAKILRVRKFRFFPKKNSKLWQPNFSETCENEKFGKFRLTQGLSHNIKTRRTAQVH
jgi:hypothetical protein